MARFNTWFGFTVVTVTCVGMLIIEPPAGITLAVVIGAIAAAQLRARSSARRRAEDGVWRVRIWTWREELVGPARFGLGWTTPYATVDVEAGPEGLALTPTRGARRLGHRARTVPWTDIVSAEEGTPSRETPDGKLSFTAQTPIEVAFTGEIAARILQPDDDAPPGRIAIALAGILDRHLDALERRLEALAAKYGTDDVPGTLPITFTTDAPDGLAAAINARARGVPAT